MTAGWFDKALLWDWQLSCHLLHGHVWWGRSNRQCPGVLWVAADRRWSPRSKVHMWVYSPCSFPFSCITRQAGKVRTTSEEKLGQQDYNISSLLCTQKNKCGKFSMIFYCPNMILNRLKILTCCYLKGAFVQQLTVYYVLFFFWKYFHSWLSGCIHCKVDVPALYISAVHLCAHIDTLCLPWATRRTNTTTPWGGL